MRILAIDIGTGTQDILLFDSQTEPENCYKMVMPSPTSMVAQAIRAATRRGDDLLLTGVTMGGGPCTRAAKEHLRAGYRVYATPEAARTFDDDLERVQEMGITIVEPGERPRGAIWIEMRDLDLSSIFHAFLNFGIRPNPDALAIAVFDHGHAPPGVSDRQFRFEYLAQRIREWPHPAALAFPRNRIPPEMTRMQAVAKSAPMEIPLLVMDTAPAAALGATLDPRIAACENPILVNIGNMHTLAFRIADGQIVGLLEHHTEALTCSHLDTLIDALAQGTLQNEAVFNEHGHGALILDPDAPSPDLVAITGPRRGICHASRHHPHFAVPFGDMMLAGCWGLIQAYATHFPEARPEIEAAFSRGVCFL